MLSTRTRCDAHVQFSVSREGDWTVQKVALAYNHHLASPNKVHKLRSHPRIEGADKRIISQIRKARIKQAKVYDFFKQWYGGAENILALDWIAVYPDTRFYELYIYFINFVIIMSVSRNHRLVICVIARLGSDD
jgi:hypothetical protein